MQMSTLMLSYFAPCLANQRDNMKNPPFEEVAFPVILLKYTDNLRSMGFTEEQPVYGESLAKGRLQSSCYTPYIVDDTAETPGQFRHSHHSSAIAKWSGGKRNLPRAISL